MINKLDPNVKLLAVLLIFFSVLMFLSEWWFRSDGAFFQGIAGGFSGILGALLGLMTKRNDHTPDTEPEVPPVTPPEPPQVAKSAVAGN